MSQQQQQPSGSAQASGSGSVAASGSGSAAPASSSAFVSIPQNAGAGGLQITQPPQTSTSYYKIANGNQVTFAWNFTSLFVTPAHLTVSAVAGGNTFPVGPTDGVIDGKATSVVWDIWSYQQNHPETPLPQNSYTLMIMDDGGKDKVASPGNFAPNTQLVFALYTPQAYTPISSGWTCGACGSAALPSFMASPVFVSCIVTFIVMFLSGFGMLRQHRAAGQNIPW